MKAVVLCNGSPPQKARISRVLEACDLFIAADGGGNVARDLDMKPDVVIGDLDSYKPREDESESVRVILDEDQETNDLEKALNYLVQRGYSEVYIFGATGYRLDHTLKNLSVLKQFNPRFEHLELREREGRLFLLPSKCTLNVMPYTPVSLFPLSGRVDGVTTEGLKYPLKDEYLENGVRDGSSNETTAWQLTISYKAGDLLIYIADMTP